MHRRNFVKSGATLLGAFPLMHHGQFTFPHSATGMESDLFKTTTGKFTCTIFRDNMFKYLAKDFFINADEETVKSALTKYNTVPDNIPSPFIAVLLQQGEKKILIDTGVGFFEKPIVFRGNSYSFKGKLNHLLQQEGISNEDITDVVITHFHPDHIGSVFSENEKLNFPNARFHMHADEWQYWHSSQSGNQPPIFGYFIEKNITRLKDQNLNLINGDFVELLPGVTAVKTNGHTPGHIAIMVHSEGEHLLYISDAFLHPLHIEKVDWQTNYDLDHQKAKNARIKLMEMAYKDDMLVNAFHFDFPGLGRIDKQKNNWVWRYSH